MNTYAPIAFLTGDEAQNITDMLEEPAGVVTPQDIIEHYADHAESVTDKTPRHLVGFPVFSEETWYRYNDYVLIADTDMHTVFILKQIHLEK